MDQDSGRFKLLVFANRRFFSSDILLDDSYEGNLRKEGRSVRIVVSISSGPNVTKVSG